MGPQQPAVQTAEPKTGVDSKARRSPKRAAWLAWFCWSLTIGLIIALTFFENLNDPSTLISDLFGKLVQFAFATVGLLIASRRSENLIGWVVVVGTLLSAAAGFVLEYAVYGLITAPGFVPVSPWVVLLGGWFRTIGFILILFVVLLLFPDGHLPSSRWRWVAWFLVASVVVQSFDVFFAPDFTDIDSRLSPFSNPLGNIIPEPISGLFGALFPLLSVVTIVACVTAIVVRFRRSIGDERQQLKWLTYSSFLSAAILMVVLAGVLLNLDFVSYVGGFLFNALLAPIPIAVGIAVLKYRLYDIDLIINRTLVYVPLTGILAGLYSATVAVLQKLFVTLTGEKSDAAIVITTLVLASLFTPVKNALQGFVDRRFKEAPDDTKRLKAFGKEMETSVYDINPRRAANRLLGEAIAAFHAKGGAIYLDQDGSLQLVGTEGDSPGSRAELTIPLQINGNRLGLLQLGPRRHGLTYNLQARDVLQQVADQAAAAIDSSLHGSSNHQQLTPAHNLPREHSRQQVHK
jgi:hypothetical protein